MFIKNFTLLRTVLEFIVGYKYIYIYIYIYTYIYKFGNSA